MANPGEILYTEGEKILCYHGPLLYEAKCLKHRISEEKEKVPEYLIHYQGWSKNWDEWVKEDRILKYSTENLTKQKDLQNQHSSAKKKGKKKSITGTPKENKSSQEIKSEGSTHDPDSRSSTPSVEGKPRGRKAKAQEPTATPPPPVATAAAVPTTPSEEEQTKPDVEIVKEVSTPEVAVPEKAKKPVDVEEEVVPAKKMRKEAVVLVSDIFFNKEHNVSLPEHATVSPIPLKVDKEVKKPVVTAADIRFNKESILYNPENSTINIPENLLNWLADDWYHITKLKRLVNLPAAVTVADILKDYKEYRLAENPTMPALEIHRVATEIEEYFSGCVGAFLLFKCERPQYADIRETYPEKLIPSIFGAHHFLRLFLKSKQLFELLPENALAAAADTFHDVLDFLSKKESKYFNTENYGIAPPEYHRRNI